MMKKYFKLFWQLLIFPVLYIPYLILNGAVIVKWLGCGCPRIAEDGSIIQNRFNANSFTLLFWTFIAVVVLGISVYSMRKIQKWYFKLLYLLFMLMISCFTVMIYYASGQWK
jgi:hypothetical protein